MEQRVRARAFADGFVQMAWDLMRRVDAGADGYREALKACIREARYWRLIANGFSEQDALSDTVVRRNGRDSEKTVVL